VSKALLLHRIFEKEVVDKYAARNITQNVKLQMLMNASLSEVLQDAELVSMMPDFF